MSTPIGDQLTYLQFKTPHYSFQMSVTKKEDTNTRYYFIVGDPEEPCLEGLVTLDQKIKNNRQKEHENKAKLMNISALYECALEDITTEYSAKQSFGKEMLDTVVFFINSQFPQITQVSLNDASQIPCSRIKENRLDLLTYSIALHKKTWQEDKLDAQILPKEKYLNQRKQVDTYASKETKEQYSFDNFMLQLQKNNYYAHTLFYSNIDFYKQMYEHAETFPDFFVKLSRTTPRKDKCMLFKYWLDSFIQSQIKIEREWQFDLYPKIEVIQQTNLKNVRNKTRRRKNVL